MTADHWLNVLARITPDEPVDLDVDTRPPVARGGGLAGWGPDRPPPSARLWEREVAATTYLGIRVEAPLANPANAAMRLAAAAIERGVTPIILSALDRSGFERFGFRVERFVPGPGADRSAWEAEMTAFWSLVLILDAGDIAALG